MPATALITKTTLARLTRLEARWMPEKRVGVYAALRPSPSELREAVIILLMSGAFYQPADVAPEEDNHDSKRGRLWSFRAALLARGFRNEDFQADVEAQARGSAPTTAYEAPPQEGETRVDEN
jgi:hypothetical protein